MMFQSICRFFSSDELAAARYYIQVLEPQVYAPEEARCPACGFRRTGKGDYLAEPCPNGCGPVARMSWKEISYEIGAQLAKNHNELKQLQNLINTPEINDWMRGASLEAAHQQKRWGTQHDAGKTAFDWFWLIGYLAQKAANSHVAGDIAKAKHHTISTAAALLNWHRALSGSQTAMRPGIAEPEAALHG